ncbi:carbon-nitrogen hydrolase family protein [Streptomyces aquilus]|uniref:carbon-nitrogen hydrolase family protein n=1 Tax=Streptomyces aquilus TaxID=2548456 RepID=UPI00367F9007
MRTQTLTLAALQTAPVPHDLEATWQCYADQIRATRRLFPHVQLVVVPELLLAAEAPLLAATDEWMEKAAITVPGPFTDRICALAAETGLWLIPGSLFERADDGRVYNTALAVSPEGEIVATYRKIFPWQPYETTTPGTAFTVFDIPGIARVGLAICYDGSFPETARQLAWLGADIIIQPTLTTTRDREMELVMARANAWTNQVYVVNVNAADPAGVGASAIVDPEGVVRQQAGTGEEILVDTLDTALVDRVRALGSNGLNRPWHQLTRYGSTLHLPAYQGGTFQPPAWAADPGTAEEGTGAGRGVA